MQTKPLKTLPAGIKGVLVQDIILTNDRHFVVTYFDGRFYVYDVFCFDSKSMQGKRYNLHRITTDAPVYLCAYVLEIIGKRALPFGHELVDMVLYEFDKSLLYVKHVLNNTDFCKPKVSRKLISDDMPQTKQTKKKLGKPLSERDWLKKNYPDLLGLPEWKIPLAIRV